MSKPIFTQHDLATISEGKFQASDVVHVEMADWVLRVTRDMPDIGYRYREGTFIVARRKHAADPGELAVVVEGDEHVLRRAPVDSGYVAGVVLGVLVREADDAA